MKSKYLLYFAYGFLTLVIIIGLIQQFFGYDSLLNSQTFSFFILLCVFSILLNLFDNPDFWARLLSLKFGPTGIELSLREASEILKKEEQDAQPNEIKDELSEIRDSSRTPVQQFLLLTNKIEEKIMKIAHVNDIRFTTGASTIGELSRAEVIDDATYQIFQSFYNVRNAIAHAPATITAIQLDGAFELGERLLNRLTYVYVQDVQKEKADEFIRNSERKNPKLKYFEGNNKSGKTGYVGMYYTLRVDE